MELKTKINAAEGMPDLTITREFELPADLLFRAYTDAGIVEQWMGTRVVHLNAHTHGSYRFETTDPRGNIHRFNGVIHEVIPNRSIVRTFEMEQTPFGVQLETYEFEALTAETSRLTMHVTYQSVAARDGVLQMPFKQGINMAHNRIEEVLRKSR